MKEGYKKTEVGVIPDDWEVSTLEQISEFITKGSTPTTYGFDWVDDGILFMKSDCVDDRGFKLGDTMKISKEAHVYMKRSEVKNGDLLISITGNIGRVGVIPDYIKEANINQHIARIRVKDMENVNNKYLYYALSRKEVVDNYEKIKTGLAYPQISLKQVRETKLAFPNIKEQEKIAEILSSVDCQITDTENLIEKCRMLKKGLMQRLLSRGIGHSEFRMSEIGEIPTSWEVKKLGEICDFRQGFQISREEQIIEEKENFVRYLYITDFFSNQNKLYVKDSEKFYYINRDDIAIANTGNTCGKAFRGAYGVLSNNMFKIFNDKNIIHNDYLWHYLNSYIYWKQLNKYFNTAGQPHVGHKNMSMLLIALPSIEEQINISKILSYVDKDIEIYKNEKQKLEKLKKGLMQQLLTGKIRVI